MTPTSKPTPQASPQSQAYWDAAAQGRLVLQCCAACGKIRHYPRLLCNTCYSDMVVWKDSSGRGKVHSWTVALHAFHPAFVADIPYTLVTVDLDEGVRALGRWRCDTSPVMGQTVQCSFDFNNAHGGDLVFKPIRL